MLDKEDVPRPKSSKCNKEVEAFTVEVQRKLVEILETEERTHPYKNIILLSLYTGMRIGEILALNRYKDIDLEHGFINIRVTLTRDEHENVIMGNTTKTYASKRKIVITPIVKHVLDSALRYWVPNPMELLFYDYPNNSLVHPGEVTSYIKRICKKYRISSKAQLQRWILWYNGHNELKDSPSGGNKLMTKARKTTFDERIEIVKYCIANDKNYALTMKKYNVSYQQIYLWVRKYEQKGIDGLIDGRGKAKAESDLTEVDRLKAQNQILEAEKKRLEMEINVLKKLQEVERRRR